MKRIISALWTLYAVLAASPAVFGQDISDALSQDFTGIAKNAPAFSIVLRQFLGSVSNFSANADYEISSAGHTAWIMPTKLAFWNGEFRLEIDVAAMPNIPLATREAAKKINFNREIFIVRLDKKVVYDLFPDFAMYIERPISEDSIRKFEEMRKASTFDETRLDEEILDGYSCVKTKLASRQFSGDQATVWYATDIKRFPIRVEMPSLNIHFKNVDLAEPNPHLFEVPTDYIRQPDSQAVVKIATERFQRTPVIQAQQLPTIAFEPPLPANWKQMQQNQRNGAGYAERTAKLTNSDGKCEIHIQFSTPSVLEQSGSFKAAAEAWKESASTPAKKAGFEIGEEKFDISPHGSRTQAVLSFRMSKGQASLFSVCKFWMDEGTAIKIAAFSMDDIRADEAVLQVLDSVKRAR